MLCGRCLHVSFLHLEFALFSVNYRIYMLAFLLYFSMSMHLANAVFVYEKHHVSTVTFSFSPGLKQCLQMTHNLTASLMEQIVPLSDLSLIKYAACSVCELWVLLIGTCCSSRLGGFLPPVHSSLADHSIYFYPLSILPFVHPIN